MKKLLAFLFRPAPVRPSLGRLILIPGVNPWRGIETATAAQAARIRGALA